MMFLAHEILDIAIRFEKNGETLYRKAMKKVSDPSLSALLEWMADEELRHRRYFSRLKREKLEKTDGLFASDSRSPDSISNDPFSAELNHGLAAEMIEEVLEKMIGAQSFSLDDIDFSAIEQQDELIRTFIEFETDTILFYEMLTPFIEDAEALATIQTIVDEENLHIERLNAFVEKEDVRRVSVDG